MNKNRIETAANIGFFAAIILYFVWRFTSYQTSITSGFLGLVVSLATAILAIVMIVKKTDGHGITLHKVVLCLPLFWFLLHQIPELL